MNILPFRLNVPAEIILERPEGILVQGRYGDRIMFTLVDGRVMYVPPFVATKIQTEGVAAGERFQLCKTQIKKGNRRSIEWTVRRIDPSEREPETQLERDLRASIEAVTANGNGISHNGSHASNPPAPTTGHEHAFKTAEPRAASGNGNGHNGTHASGSPAPPTKLEYALKTAISAAYNAERYGAELGYVVRFDADAIKSMAITVLINMSGGNQR